MEPESVSRLQVELEEEPRPNWIDEQSWARRQAAIRQMRFYGDPVLRMRAREVVDFDDSIRAQVDRMRPLLIDGIGYGLAANQVGSLHRLFVYHLELEDPVEAMINPVVEWASEETDFMEENCFSLPGVTVEVERPIAIRWRAQDEFGVEKTAEYEGLAARAFQHEVDHLDGILSIDRTSKSERKQAMRVLREMLTERS